MGKRVSLFVTCIVDQLFPKVGMAMAEVLERLGYQVDFPENQTCCGQPAFNSGYRARGAHGRPPLPRHLRSAASASWSPRAPAPRWSTHHFAELFQKEPETLARVHALEKRVFEFSTFLTEVAGVEDVGRAVRRRGHVPRRLPRAARARHQERAAPPAGATCAASNCARCMPAEECCGFGGTFSVKFAELSGAMARTKIEAIERTGAAHRGLARSRVA